MELCKIVKVIYIKFMNKREAEIINDAVVEELKKLCRLSSRRFGQNIVLYLFCL